MFNYFKKLLIIWAVFILLGSIAGGGLLRSFGDKAGGVAQKVIEVLAAKADDLKNDADLIVSGIRYMLGGKKGIARNARGDTGSGG